MTEDIVEILLVEDNPNDVELTLHALKTNHLANHVTVVRDGAEALEFIFGTGNSRTATSRTAPRWCCST